MPCASTYSATAFLASLGGIQGGCLITDVRMPDMTGIELLHQMRMRACNLPAIVMTGHADVSLAVEAMRVGAIDFIEKPFDEKALVHADPAALDAAREGEGARRGGRPARLARFPAVSARC